MAYQMLIVDLSQPPIAIVRLNRPEAANALNTQIALEIKDFFANLPQDMRCIIITGEGKHFCAGADLKERRGMKEETWKAQHEAFRGARDAVINCPIPVIAAVHGAAYAGGLELALACDFIYAARDATFALTEATLGIMPGMGGTQTLPRAIGTRRAKELTYTGKTFSAEEAHAWGVVNAVCDAAKLLDAAMACAKTIAGNAPLSVRAIKQSIQTGAHLSLPEAFAKELHYYHTLLTTKDRVEGINAFNEKRKPVFTGE